MNIWIFVLFSESTMTTCSRHFLSSTSWLCVCVSTVWSVSARWRCFQLLDTNVVTHQNVRETSWRETAATSRESIQFCRTIWLFYDTIAVRREIQCIDDDTEGVSGVMWEEVEHGDTSTTVTDHSNVTIDFVSENINKHGEKWACNWRS